MKNKLDRYRPEVCQENVNYFQNADRVQNQKHDKPFLLMVNPEIFTYLTNVEYDSILQLEKAIKGKIEIESKKDFKVNQYKIEKK